MKILCCLVCLKCCATIQFPSNKTLAVSNSAVGLPVGHVDLVRGEWIPGSTAGGSRNDLESFAKNPQYVLSLNESGQLLILFSSPYTFLPS